MEQEHLVAQPGRFRTSVSCRELQPTGPIGHWSASFHDGGGRCDSRFWLSGSRRRAAAQPSQLRSGQVSAHVFSRRLLFGARCFGFEVAGVPAFVHIPVTAIDLEHLGGDAVEHVAVMGDQHQTASESGQAILEPGDGIDVEVVGRLVEDQQVDLLDEHHRQSHPLGLAAGEGGGVGARQWAHAETLNDGGRLPVGADGLGHRSVWEVGPLAQEPHPHGPTAADSAVFRRQAASQHAQQGRLARAVPAHDAEPVAGRDRDRQVFEQRPLGPAHGDLARVDEDHRRSG